MEKFTAERWHVIEIDGMPRNNYQVSDRGRIKSKNGIIKGSRIQGYNTLNLRVNGNSVIFYIHKLVAKYFLDEPESDQLTVIHLDKDKLNNWNTNLKWATVSEKCKHAVNCQTESRVKNCKLRESQVKAIKTLIEEGYMSQNRIAEIYKISTTQVRRIRTGENWGNV